ncbi:protein kinase [Sphaerisporangium sp. B11E5]|uniref:protein kinase domain-containing protein n=1 Tax=Sphaerisporangium sp. B11E5 TaxID=3153563 RepID=UPI00325DE459
MSEPPYIASEFVDGPTLQHVIETRGPRHGAGLHRLAITTIRALAAIHRAGVVHRDFKPGNVLIGVDRPRVIDFGIARLTGASATTGGAAGSPAYMAPEHFTGERIGPKADVFAWGSTITYAATSRWAAARRCWRTPPPGDGSRRRPPRLWRTGAARARRRPRRRLPGTRSSWPPPSTPP